VSYVRYVVESTMRTNFYGTVAVTQAVLPLIERAGRSQIINVSSELGSISRGAVVDVFARVASRP
jgi:NAD(P)-dependent dehydrogenase (short-subunit alcohol dehydrogenase family)